jgi:hypothetical protein
MKAHTSWVLLASLAIHGVAFAGGKAAEPRTDVDSPRIAAVAEALKADRSRVLETFWDEMKDRARLIEPI